MSIEISDKVMEVIASMEVFSEIMKMVDTDKTELVYNTFNNLWADFDIDLFCRYAKIKSDKALEMNIVANEMRSRLDFCA